jgi:hypothetical protein
MLSFRHGATDCREISRPKKAENNNHKKRDCRASSRVLTTRWESFHESPRTYFLLR